MRILLVCFSFFISFSSTAELLFSASSLSYLNGSNYTLGDNKRQILTFEHASGHSWGDTFLFIDRIHSDNGHKTTYGEFSPRFYISQFDKNNLLKDISIATTVEMGDGFTHYLGGVGFSWNLPSFTLFKTNFYRRNNHSGGSNWQMTASWAIPFKVAKSNWQYDGFVDWYSAVDGKPSGYNFTSQLKLNIAPWLGAESPVFVGTEYVYWTNKFGVRGINERNINLLIKWHW